MESADGFFGHQQTPFQGHALRACDRPSMPRRRKSKLCWESYKVRSTQFIRCHLAPPQGHSLRACDRQSAAKENFDGQVWLTHCRSKRFVASSPCATSSSSSCVRPPQGGGKSDIHHASAEGCQTPCTQVWKKLCSNITMLKT